MNKIKYLIIIFLFFISALFSQDENINKYKFEVYYLIKGQMKKNKARPDFGWRILKTFPLSVKEYTFTSQFYDYNSNDIKEIASEITKELTEARKKNGVYIADAIYKYINENIETREIIKEIKNNPNKIYFSYRQVLNEKKACDVEKCRLAITLLRYFTIPARMVYINDHYAVEYFIMPLKGKGDWFLMDFTEKDVPWQEYVFPVSWHPLDCKEVLNENWNNTCAVYSVDIKNIFLPNDEQEAENIYNQITTSAKGIDDILSGETPDKGKFIMLKRIIYELWIPDNQKNTKVVFILPFNAVNFFRTKYWYVRSIDEGLELKMKRIHTEVKPPQEGMIITLPVEFYIN